MTLTGSYARPEWKTQIHYSCAQAERLDPDGAGPIRLTVAYDIGPGRNWTSLWKPTINGLGTLVGSLPRPAKVLDDPRDGRITDLSLHREINVDLGHTVRISFWWESRMGAAE